ncbi:MAG: ROK family protein [Nitrososphaerota archaeon]
MDKFILAADIGGSKIRIGLFDENLNILKLSIFPTPREPLPEKIPESIIENVRKIMCDYINNVRVFSIASMGPLDFKRGVIAKTPTVGAKNVPLIKILREWLDADYYLLNDCNAAAYAEWWLARSEGVRSLVYITISSGIGGGAVVDDQLLIGKDGNAAEVGHIVIDPTGYMECGCGGLGHWEAYCSAANLVKYAAKLVHDGVINSDNELSKLVLEKRLTSEGVYRLYELGDKGAVMLLNRVTAFNAAGISSVITCYDPEVLVLGGAVVLNNLKYFQNNVIPLIDNYLGVRKPKIITPKHGELSPLMGAALVAKNKIDDLMIKNI